jgi:hypothetical protein
MREEFRTKPDYAGRKTGIDRDNAACAIEHCCEVNNSLLSAVLHEKPLLTERD